MLPSQNEKLKVLFLDQGVFLKLHEDLLKAFENRYGVKAKLLQDYQLYGYGNYSEKEPSIKMFIFETTGFWANGKYIYNKLKEIQKGVKKVKISREFILIYFNALKCIDIFDYLEKNTSISDEDKKNQFVLLGSKQTQFEYYVANYWGENNGLIKCKFIIKDGYEVDWILYYWENDDAPSVYAYKKGKLSLNRSGYVVIFPKEHSDLKADAFINIYAGNINVLIRKVMLGSYMGFDKNNCPVVGEILFQKMESESEMNKFVLDRSLNPAIVEKLKDKRIIVKNVLPQDLNEIESNSITLIQANLFDGVYQIVYTEENGEIVTYRLHINGQEFFITMADGIFKGNFIYFNKTNMIFNLNANEVTPFYGQLIFFIGRRIKTQINSIIGKFSTINFEMKPVVFDTVLSFISS